MSVACFVHVGSFFLFFSTEPRNCSNSQFQCDNGHCITGSWRCDGDFDCRDHSDERNCTTVERRPNSDKHCSENEFQCSSGECIRAEWACDSEPDCSDSSDETGCNGLFFERYVGNEVL